MKAKLEALLCSAMELKTHREGVEVAALAFEGETSVCTAENKLECLLYKLLEEVIDNDVAISRALEALLCAEHEHLVQYHGMDGGAHGAAAGHLTKL